MEKSFIDVYLVDSLAISIFSKFSYISEKFCEVIGKVVVGLMNLIWKLFWLHLLQNFLFFDRDSFILVEEV